MPAPRLEPFQHIAAFIVSERRGHVTALASGKWSDEVAGKMLVARIAMCDDLMEEIRRISGNTHFGEEDIH